MSKRILPLAVACMALATAAQAQHGGGPGGGHGRGGGGGRGGQPPPSSSAGGQPDQPRKTLSQPEIVGVIKAIDTDGGRLTIAYEPVEALNWPAGQQPFAVEKTALLKDLTVGEKVRFTVESLHIVAIRPFQPPPQP